MKPIHLHLPALLFLGLLLIPLLYLGCAFNTIDKHDGVQPPISDPAKLLKPQGVHVTGRINLPFVDPSYFLEPEFYRAPSQLAGLRGTLASATDLSNFTILGGGQETKCDASGYFSLGNVPAAESFLFTAISPNGRIQLKRQLLISLGDGASLQDVALDIDSTAQALLFNAALDSEKYVNLEYLPALGATTDLKNLLTRQLQASATALNGHSILATREVLESVGRFVSSL